jgi:hypothetical protein
MTNKHKRSKQQQAARSAGARSASSVSSAETEPAPRRGLLDSILAPRAPGSTSMPSIRASIARGATVVTGTPALAVGVVLVVIAQWLGALALGYEGPFALFVSALALPPVGTSFDASLSTSLFGLQGGFVAILGFVAVRAVLQSVLVAASVETLRSISYGRWTFVRALRTLPSALAVNVASIGLLTLASIVGPLLGPAFGLLIQMGVLVGGVYLLSFAPVIAADEGRRLPDAMGRSLRAARMPGAGNLTFAAIYVVASIAVLVAPGKPGADLGVNPTVAAWTLVLVANMLHVVVSAAVAFRYLSVAGEVPDAAPKARPASRSRARR